LTIQVNPANPKGLVWLASYPKSGNTWVRAFLYGLYHAILGDLADDIDINKMDDLSVNDRDADHFRKYLSAPPESVDSLEIAEARPKVQADIAREANGTVLIKTHNALAYDRGFPLINLDVSAGAVYLVRNPLDVAISFAHFRNVPIDTVIADMATPGSGVGSNNTLVYYTADTWSTHVRSWTERPNPVVLVVRYEDLLAEPRDGFAAIARHVRMAPTPEQLDQAIELASFRRLRKAEAAGGFRERPEHAERFFREGRAGQWREVLTPSQVDRIVADHGEQMARFGYLPQ